MSASHSDLAIIHGAPLEEEPGLGALTLAGYLREVTGRYAGREALVFYDAGTRISWTYSRLYERAMTVARALLSLQCGKDTRVGVLMTNRPEWLAAVFGAAIAGCVAVPLSTFATERELAYLLRASAVSVLLLERRVARKDFLAMLEALEPGILMASGARSRRFPHLRHVALVGEAPTGSGLESWEAFSARAEQVPAELAQETAAEVRPSDVGAILFSSGSTARPKGIVNSQRGIAIHLWRWRRMFALGDDVRCWTPNGFFWSGNFGCALGATLSAGGALLLQSVFDPAAALDLMHRERVTFPYAWPHQWKQILEAPNWSSVDLGSIVYLDSAQPLARHPTIRLRGWTDPRFSYGSTETFTISTGYPGDAPREVMQGTNGIALPGNTVKIVDPATSRILKRGEQGEIAVKGPTLMLGYLGLPPEQTFDPEGFYRTGDAGWIDEQDRLHFEGRLSTIIKTGGANVSPIEVDQILEEMPGVRIARCVGVPDEALGERVVACIVPAEGSAVSAEEVRAHARAHLASYKVPREVLLLEGGELELTGSSKTKPAALRTLAMRKLGLLSDEETGPGELPGRRG